MVCRSNRVNEKAQIVTAVAWGLFIILMLVEIALRPDPGGIWDEAPARPAALEGTQGQ